MGDKIDKIKGVATPGLHSTQKNISSRGSPQRGHMWTPYARMPMPSRYWSSSALMLQTCSNASQGIHD